MKDINLNGQAVSFYTLCVIAAALEQHGEVTIRGGEIAKRPRTTAQWLALLDSMSPRRQHGE